MNKRDILGFCIIVLILSILACEAASPEQRAWVESLKEGDAVTTTSSDTSSNPPAPIESSPDYSKYAVDIVSSVSPGTSVKEALSTRLKFADGTTISFGYEASTDSWYYKIGKDREKHDVDTSGYNGGNDIYVVLTDPQGGVQVYHTSMQ